MILIKHAQDPYLNPSMECQPTLFCCRFSPWGSARRPPGQRTSQRKACRNGSCKDLRWGAVPHTNYTDKWHVCGEFLFQISVFFLKVTIDSRHCINQTLFHVIIFLDCLDLKWDPPPKCVNWIRESTRWNKKIGRVWRLVTYCEVVWRL